jgi:hypothetical protein
MGELKKWREEKWVRIGTDGSILGEHVKSRACINCQKEKATRGEEAVCLKHKSWKSN